MFLFERASAKGKNREARPGGLLRQQKYRRGLPPGANLKPRLVRGFYLGKIFTKNLL